MEKKILVIFIFFLSMINIFADIELGVFGGLGYEHFNNYEKINFYRLVLGANGKKIIYNNNFLSGAVAGDIETYVQFHDNLDKDQFWMEMGSLLDIYPLAVINIIPIELVKPELGLGISAGFSNSISADDSHGENMSSTLKKLDLPLNQDSL